MKRLLTVCIVGLLAACGSSTPEVSTPVYPQLAGTWSDPDGQMVGCMGKQNAKTVMTVEQTGAELRGEFGFRNSSGTYTSWDYVGQVSSAGRITGEVRIGDNAIFDMELDKYPSMIIGSLTHTESSECVDGSGIKRWIFTVGLERE